MPLATVSSRGTIKLPTEVLKAAGIKSRQCVRVEVRKGTIVIRRVRDFFDLEGFLGKGLPPDEERRRMAEGVARHVLGLD